MSLLIRLSQRWTRHTASAIVVTGLGLSGIAGCAFNLSPGERLAATAREEQETKPPVTTSALSRVLRRNNAETSTETEEQATSSSSTTIARGRLFSAIVDRFPSRHKTETDPFLESEIEVEEAEPQTAQLGEASDSHTEGLSRRSLVQTSAPERSDEYLWNRFSNDVAGVARPGQDDPTLTAQQPAAAPVAVESLPDWARPQAPQVAEHAATAPTRTASTSTESPPVRTADSNPFARFQAEPTVETEEAESDIVGSARKGVQNLVSQARTHDERGAPQKAHEPAVAAASFAQREHIAFAGDDVLPADAVGGVDQRTHAATRDPFGDPPTGSAGQLSPRGTSPFASGSDTGMPAGAPWTTQVEPEAPSRTTPSFAGDRPKPATPFPTAPEWRGVRANSPVSLAVVEQHGPTVAIEDPSDVRHADVSGFNTAARPGRLLPRSLPAHDPIFSSDDQTLALTVPPAATGPLLAPPVDMAPLAIAPPPAPELDLTGPPVLAATGETHDRTRGYGGWIIGGALLAAGMWLFGFGNRRPTRRHTAADQK
jgi:hypothetical protein